jgi:hypothetical protein
VPECVADGKTVPLNTVQVRPVDEPVHLVRERAQDRSALFASRRCIRHYRTSLPRSVHHLISISGLFLLA